MLLSVIYPNISYIVNVTGGDVDEEEVERMIHESPGQVIIYTPSGRYAFVPESHIDKIFDGILDIMGD